MSTEIERALLQYRAKKNREEYIKTLKERTKVLLTSLVPQKSSVSLKPEAAAIVEEEEEEEESDDFFPTEPENIDETPLFNCTPIDYFYYFLCFVLWTTVYAIFIKLEFGIVYLIVSGLVLMYVNTRTGPKKKNEISAYSVFNKNCEKIPGTFDAEQLQREMLYGVAAVKT